MKDVTTPALPIDTVLPELRQALCAHNRCLLVAQPGAGKTTRVPLALLEDTASDRGRWLLLEPRRVAARLAAGFMAAALHEKLGETVGLRVRGESKVSDHTRLEVVTQGVLTRMLQDDPTLDGIAGIIFDEFHERSLEADLGLTLALDVQQSLREDLKLLIMSATLDTGALLDILGADTPLIDCPGRSWPVSTYHRSRAANEKDEQHQRRVIREALASHEGSILVFLPGQREIRRLSDSLLDLTADIDVCPLHGQLSLGQQQAVLRRSLPGRRRIILATAIAESSLTVPGVSIVIDAGRERVPIFQPRSGLTRLHTRQVNRASADQRRGRAGREAAGYCYRLWPQEQILAPHREPEILQADLSGLVFELLRWGVKDVDQLSWVTPPPATAIASGRQLLEALGIVEADARLTRPGRQCSRWPAHPRLAVMLETAVQLRQLPLACWLVAWLEESPGGMDSDISQLLEQRSGREVSGSKGRWYRAAAQWARRAGCSLQIGSSDAAGTLLAHAYPDRIAQHQGGGRFKLRSGGQAILDEKHPLSRCEFLVAVELDGLASGARIFHAAAVSREALQEAFPETATWREEIHWDNQAGRLIGEACRGLGPLIFERRPLKTLPPQAVQRALLAALRQRGRLSWSAEDLQLLGRLRLVHRHLGEPWPDVSEEALLASMEHWLLPWLDKTSRLEQLDRLPLGEYLLNSVDWSLQQQLKQLLPTHIRVPAGSNIRIDYSGDEPVLAVKLQEMFGQTETPTVLAGRVPLLVHLLSPARRPVQVTRDLAGFWAGSYFDVRRDLRGRYPKHPWPEDPLQAQATAYTSRHSAGAHTPKK